MSLISSAIRAVERAPLPDSATRCGIGVLVGRTRRRLATAGSVDEKRFAGDMAGYSIAEHTAAANEQHYELPPEFFALTLGPNRKYSCCLYPNGDRFSLALTCIDRLTRSILHEFSAEERAQRVQ
ncbi:MAG: class I SAM-dependent methyltransferase, partial [Mesorhizobium sp.]|nr:class I SAM-dependent methyltransferase [Mesorhizobium sp.]